MLVLDAERLLCRMVLSGRTILYASDSPGLDGTQEFLLSFVAQAGRRDAIARVGIGAPGFHTLTPQHCRPCLPDKEAWYGLPSTKPIKVWRPDLPEGPEMWNPARPPEWMYPGRRLRPAGGRPLSGVDAQALIGDGSGPLLDPRPSHDPGPALAGGGVVLVDASSPVGMRYFHWLAYACIEAAEQAGRPVPLIVGKIRSLHELKEILSWTSTSTTDATIFHPQNDVTVVGRDHRDARRWQAMVANREAHAETSFADDVWSVRGEGRSLHAIRVGCFDQFNPRHPERESVIVTQVDASGFLSAHRLRLHRRIPDAEMIDLSMGAWLGRVENLSHDMALAPASPFRDLSSLLRRESMPTAATLALRERLVGDMGEDAVAFLCVLTDQTYIGALQVWAGTGARASVERRQFARSYPALVNLALDPELSRLVDARRSPLPRLCALTGAPKAVVARFGSQLWTHRKLDNPADWLRVGSVMGALGHGSMPAHDASFHWYALQVVLQALARLDRGGSITDAAPLGRLAARVPGRSWVERRTWISRIDVQEIQDAGDMLRSLRDWLQAFAGREVAGLDILVLAEWYGSLARILRASEAWHANPTLRSSHGSLPPDTTWPVPFGVVQLGDSGQAVALASVADLVAEGGHGRDTDGVEGLRHCVAGYGETCAKGTSLIVSLRAVDPASSWTERLSTLQLCPDTSGDWLIAGRPYAKRQHRGLGNGDPPPNALVHEGRLRWMLRNGLDVDASALDPRPFSVFAARADCVREMHPYWRPILPPRLTRLDAEGLLAALGAEAVGAGMDEAA